MNRNSRNGGSGWIALAAIACLAGGTAARADGDVQGPWTAGHGDLSVGYIGSGTSFGFEVHLHTGAVVDGTALTEDAHGEPDHVPIVVPGSANLRRIDNPTGFFEGGTGYYFTGTDFNATGAAVNGNLWMLGSSADAGHYGTPFVGLSAEELVPGDWTGNISLVLQGVSFDGSEYGTTGGILSFFSEELEPLWSSQGGTQIPIELIPGAGHLHGFFFFSQPGTYDMTLLASGVLNEESTAVGGSAVYTFQVVPEPSSIAMAGLGVASLAGAAVRRRMRMGQQSSATPRA